MKQRTKYPKSTMSGINNFFLALLILFIIACQKEDPKIIPETPIVTNDTVQYDVPFKNVPAISDIIMYEVNLRAFSPGRNLKGVQARLDSIKNLGINVIWLMPIYPTGVLNGVGSPYSVKSYEEVNPAYGSLNDLRELVKEAHQRNIAVILDWVANHTSWDNPWIKNRSWYTQDASGNMVSPNGWNDVADLNFSNQAMRNKMMKAMKYWVLMANVDGYRCDYADGVPSDFWKQAIDTLKSIPNRKMIMFAEGTRTDHYSAGFSLTFGWNFYGKLKDVINKNLSVRNLVTTNNSDYTNIPEGSHILRFISNHDDDAWDDTPINIFKGKAGSLAAFVLTSYMGGVPLIYNGQEVGCPEKLSFFTSGTNQIDWKLNPEMTQEYKKLLKFRKSSPAVKNGSVETFDSNPDVMAFKRVKDSEQVLVIVNVRDVAKTYKLPIALANTSWKNALTGSGVSLETSLALDPFSYLILKNQ